MAKMVEVLARTPGTFMLEGGRVGGYEPIGVSERYWAMMGRKFGHMVMTVDAYALHVRKLDVKQLRAECTRQAKAGRDVDRGGIHEMRAALLDGIAPYEPSKHPTEADEDPDAEEMADPVGDEGPVTDVDRVEAADDKDALKALVDELDMGDDVDLRYGADKLRAAMLDVLEGDDGKDS